MKKSASRIKGPISFPAIINISHFKGWVRSWHKKDRHTIINFPDNPGGAPCSIPLSTKGPSALALVIPTYFIDGVMWPLVAHEQSGGCLGFTEDNPAIRRMPKVKCVKDFDEIDFSYLAFEAVSCEGYSLEISPFDKSLAFDGALIYFAYDIVNPVGRRITMKIMISDISDARDNVDVEKIFKKTKRTSL